MSLEQIIMFIVLLWISIYTISFGRWTWKKKNRLGAVMVFVIVLATLVLPVYTSFFIK